MRKLTLRFDCQDIILERNDDGKAVRRTYNEDVTNKIYEKIHEEWNENMEGKSSLGRYRAFKSVRGTIEHIYHNSRGSTLLAEARAGFLMTRKFRSRFEEIDPRCETCGSPGARYPQLS